VLADAAGRDLSPISAGPHLKEMCMVAPYRQNSTSAKRRGHGKVTAHRYARGGAMMPAILSDALLFFGVTTLLVAIMTAVVGAFG
jgi:hypothetical protein